MKAERKHELQHNELDDLLIKGSSFFREHGPLILGVVGVVIVGAIAYWTLLAPRPITADAGLWEENFLAVEKNAARITELRDRAWLGLAEVYESQSKSEEARKYYGMLAKNSPDSPLGKTGARGERRMAQKNNQEFLTWFAQQKPVKK